MHTRTATTFQHANYLGSNDTQTNSSQTVTATQVTDAWGNLRSSTGTFAGPFGFVGSQGYQQDSDSGLMLLGHRYYDSSTGRFLTRDAVKQGRDWYVYCADNPTGRCDPGGDEWNFMLQLRMMSALYYIIQSGGWFPPQVLPINQQGGGQGVSTEGPVYKPSTRPTPGDSSSDSTDDPEPPGAEGPPDGVEKVKELLRKMAEAEQEGEAAAEAGEIIEGGEVVLDVVAVVSL